jgi:hypothetical protein
MMVDPELEQWSELFRSKQGEPTEIVERAKKAVRRFRLLIYSEVAVTVVMGGGAIFWALRAHQTSVTLLAVWVWISLAAAWLFRLFNDWNDFTGVAVATGSYLAVLRRRLRSNLRAAEFGGLLFFVQLGVTSAWVFRELNRQSPISLREYLALPTNIVFAIGTVVLCVWLVLYRRKLKKEIAQLEKLKPELDEESISPSLKPVPTIPAVIAHAISNLERLRKKKLRVF